MRTPGDDEELALGFCITEGLAPATAGPADDLAGNVVEVTAPGAELDRVQRSFYTSSSCGVCGKGSLEEVAVHAPVLPDGTVVDRALLASLPEHLRQPAFVRTGGMHATGLFTSAGELVLAREDVGRHNAMDKVVGRALRDEDGANAIVMGCAGMARHRAQVQDTLGIAVIDPTLAAVTMALGAVQLSRS